jgi:hypothetical protein
VAVSCDSGDMVTVLCGGDSGDSDDSGLEQRDSCWDSDDSGLEQCDSCCDSCDSKCQCSGDSASGDSDDSVLTVVTGQGDSG